MKYLAIIITLIFLPGCASISMTKTGDDVTWESKTLWKDISEVNAQAMQSNGGSFTFGLGASTGSLTPQQTQMMLCLLNPAMCPK